MMVLDKVKVVVPERIARSLTGCHPVPIMSRSSMSLLRQGVIYVVYICAAIEPQEKT
jgi:hypothetical protein